MAEEQKKDDWAGDDLETRLAAALDQISRLSAENKRLTSEKTNLSADNETSERFLELSGGMLAQCDDNLLLRYCNERFEKNLGYLVGELEGRPMQKIVHPDDWQKFLAALSASNSQTPEFQASYRMMTKEGQVLWTQSQARQMQADGTEQYLFFIKDITEKKDEDNMLREKVRLLESLLGNFPGRIFIKKYIKGSLGSGGIYAYANPEMLELVGKDLAHICMSTDFELFDPKTAKKFITNDADVLESGITKRFDEQVVGADGRMQHYLSIKFPIPSREDGTYILGGIALDITEYKKARERFRLFAEQSPLGISLISQDGRYRYLNPKFREMFGYDLTDIPDGKTWFLKAFPDESYRRKIMDAWNADLEKNGHSKKHDSRPRDYRVRCKDGTYKEIRFLPVTTEGKEQFVMYLDITESVKADALQREADRQKTMLDAAAIAADRIKNPLQLLEGRVSMMEMYLSNPADPDKRRIIRNIRQPISDILEFLREFEDIAKGNNEGTSLCEKNQVYRPLNLTNHEILLVDDIAGITEVISEYLIGSGYTVHTANNYQEGLDCVKEYKPGIVILDFELNDPDGKNGVLLRQEANTINPDAAYILLTAHTKDFVTMESGQPVDDFLCSMQKPINLRTLGDMIKNIISDDKENDSRPEYKP